MRGQFICYMQCLKARVFFSGNPSLINHTYYSDIPKKKKKERIVQTVLPPRVRVRLHHPYLLLFLIRTHYPGLEGVSSVMIWKYIQLLSCRGPCLFLLLRGFPRKKCVKKCVKMCRVCGKQKNWSSCLQYVSDDMNALQVSLDGRHLFRLFIWACDK